MKQIFNHNGEVVVRDVPVPGTTANMVLVATQASLVSAGTESASLAVAGRPLVRRALAQPGKALRAVRRMVTEDPSAVIPAILDRVSTDEPLGYSAAGIAIGVGTNINDLVLGDRVACAGVGYANHAEVIAVPRLLAARIPDGVALEAAAYTTVGAIALQGVRRVRTTPGEYVVVLGLGLLGQLAAQVLRASGCRVLGTDLDPHRVAVAQALDLPAIVAGQDDSVEALVQAETSGYGADAVLVAAASTASAPVEQGLRLCRKRGRIVLLGATGLELDRELLYRKELDVLMSTSYGPGRYDPLYEEEGHDYPLAYVRWTENRNMLAFLELLRSGRVLVDRLTELRASLDEAPSAYQQVRSGSPRPIGVILTYPQASAYASARQSRRLSLPVQAPVSAQGRECVRVGVIGGSAFARETVLPALSTLPQVDIRVVVSRDGANAARLARRFRVPYATSSSDDVLSDPAIDAVFITSRHSEHAPLAMHALRAGKHVFLEKPMATNEREAADLAAAAAATGLRFAVGFNRRFAPFVIRLLDFVNRVSGPRLIHYRVNALKLPPNHWQYDSEEGGGRIVGESCHFLDLLCFLVGGLPSHLAAFQATGQATDHPSNEDLQVLMTFPDGSVTSLLYTALGDASLPKERIEVFRAGTVGVLDNFQRLSLHSGGRKRVTTSPRLDKGHRSQFETFIRAVRNQGLPYPVGPREALASTILTFRTLESAASAEALHLSWV